MCSLHSKFVSAERYLSSLGEFSVSEQWNGINHTQPREGEGNMGTRRAKQTGGNTGLPWLACAGLGRTKVMSKDTLHEQISNRAASPTLEAKGLSSKAKLLAGCQRTTESWGRHRLLHTGTIRYLEAAGGKWFPHFFPAWHGELWLGKHSWTYHGSWSRKGIPRLWLFPQNLHLGSLAVWVLAA